MDRNRFEFRKATFWQKITVAFVAGTILYLLASLVIYTILLAYAFVTGIATVTIERAIMEIPAEIGFVTFGIGICVALIDSLMYRDTTNIEESKKEE